MTLAGYKWRKGACAQYLDHRIGLKLCSKGSTPHWSGVVRNGESKLNARPEDVKQLITPHAKCFPLSVSKGSHSTLCFHYVDFTAGFCFHPSYVCIYCRNCLIPSENQSDNETVQSQMAFSEAWSSNVANFFSHNPLMYLHLCTVAGNHPGQVWSGQLHYSLQYAAGLFQLSLINPVAIRKHAF